MKKVLMVIANNGFRDEEYFQPKKILQNNGIAVTTAALEPGVANGALGGEANVDVDVKYLLEEDDRIEEYDAVAFIGGQGMSLLVDNELLHELARLFLSSGKLVAGICVAPVLLAKAGILRGKQATVYNDQTYIEELVNDNAEYVPDDIVEDGNIITANGPRAAYKFGSALVKKLS